MMQSQDINYYDVLGVPNDADDKTIKQAYHKLAMKWHPDRNDSPEAEEKFKQIATAYAILKDPKKRAQYDSQGMEGVAHYSPEDLFGGLDMGDIFGDMGFGFGGNSIFDRMFSGGRRASQPEQGQDLRVRINVPLSTVNEGGREDIRVSHPVLCETCHGYGTADGKAPSLCAKCNGSGRIVTLKDQPSRNEHVRIQQITICPDCHGKGTYIKSPCKNCSGYGKVEKEETLKITIPKGIDEGSVLRIAGHGLPADTPALPSGDLYVLVYSQADSRFQRRGADLWRSESISVLDAVLGTKITVPTLDGTIKVKIPAGTQPEDILRIRGKGLPFYKKLGHGNLNLRILVKIPQKITREEKHLYEKLRDLNGR